MSVRQSRLQAQGSRITEKTALTHCSFYGDSVGFSWYLSSGNGGLIPVIL